MGRKVKQKKPVTYYKSIKNIRKTHWNFIQ